MLADIFKMYTFPGACLNFGHVLLYCLLNAELKDHEVTSCHLLPTQAPQWWWWCGHHNCWWEESYRSSIGLEYWCFLASCYLVLSHKAGAASVNRWHGCISFHPLVSFLYRTEYKWFVLNLFMGCRAAWKCWFIDRKLHRHLLHLEQHQFSNEPDHLQHLQNHPKKCWWFSRS